MKNKKQQNKRALANLRNRKKNDIDILLNKIFNITKK